MSDKEVLEAIKEHVKSLDDYMKRQGKAFKFRASPREMLTADQMIQRLDKDPKFRKLVVKMVIGQTVEILGRIPK